MSTIDALGDLARIIGKSPGGAGFDAQRRAVANGIAAGIELKPLNRRASDLLGAVLALSARTRRIVQPRVEVDLDVFSPDGRRAVFVQLNQKS